MSQQTWTDIMNEKSIDKHAIFFLKILFLLKLINSYLRNKEKLLVMVNPG